MINKFKKVGIISHLSDEKILTTAKNLIIMLEKTGIEVVLETNIAKNLSTNEMNLTILSSKTIGKICDLIIVIGGDGSFLSASRDLIGSRSPILGINRGHLGFLTDIKPDDLEKILPILEGNYISERRFVLQAQMIRDGKILETNSAVNDVVLHPGEWTKIIEFELFINDDFVSSQKADGLIIATPTGSTAYALSAGGPIIYPSLQTMLIVPMYPHTLTNRPIVVDSNSQITLKIANNSIKPHISCDGHSHFECLPGDIINITKQSGDLILVHPIDYDYYHTCREKLGWGKALT